MPRKVPISDQPELKLGDVFRITRIAPAPMPEGWGSPLKEPDERVVQWNEVQDKHHRDLLRRKFVMLWDKALSFIPGRERVGYPWIEKEELKQCEIKLLGTTRTNRDHWHIGGGYVALFGGKTILCVELDSLVGVNFVKEPEHSIPTFRLTLAGDTLWRSSCGKNKKRPESAFTIGQAGIRFGANHLGRPANSELYVLPQSVPEGGMVYYRCSPSDVGSKAKWGLRKTVKGRLTHLCRELDNGHILFDIIEELLVQSPDPLDSF